MSGEAFAAMNDASRMGYRKSEDECRADAKLAEARKARAEHARAKAETLRKADRCRARAQAAEAESRELRRKLAAKNVGPLHVQIDKLKAQLEAEQDRKRDLKAQLARSREQTREQRDRCRKLKGELAEQRKRHAAARGTLPRRLPLSDVEVLQVLLLDLRERLIGAAHKSANLGVQTGLRVAAREIHSLSQRLTQEAAA